MDPQNVQTPWALARVQHGVVSRRQLLDCGLSEWAIRHRVNRGRLHVVRRGVYAVGRAEITREGEWMAAVVGCGDGAALSHHSAAAHYRIRPDRPGPIHVSVPPDVRPRGAGIAVHRRAAYDTTRRRGIPITTPVQTLLDLATCLPRDQLDAAVNEADVLDLIDPERLRGALDGRRGQPGVAPLRLLLDRRTFRLTRSELERLFLRIVRRAGLPIPLTRQRVNGFEVDFYWPALGLVVETDGLRYHRTPAKQERDSRRDQAHAAAGLPPPLRFTHGQLKFEPEYVAEILTAVVQRVSAGGRAGAARRTPRTPGSAPAAGAR
jgi:very-short-patch-repair endonuclease